MITKQVVVQYKDKKKKNGRPATSLVEYDAEDHLTNEFIIKDVLTAFAGQGKPCVRCFIVEK